MIALVKERLPQLPIDATFLATLPKEPADQMTGPTEKKPNPGPNWWHRTARTLLYENEGLTQDLFHTFLIYVASSPRPAHEVLDPNLIDLGHPYAREFEGMTRTPVPLDTLLATRQRLVDDPQSRLDDKAGRFLLSLQDGTPDFAAIGRPQTADMPAVKGTLLNLNKLKRDNPEKHAAQREALLKLLG